MVASAKTVSAVERLARADRRLAATISQWDHDPWLLNTQTGVVDLRTGRIRTHAPIDYMTQICAVGPEGSCPTWLTFLDRITNGDAELQSYLQRLAGYCLTGSTREEALFYGHGSGSNGKSKFLGAIGGMMADYHVVAPIETFTISSGEHHPTELAGATCARLVTSIETEQGRRWAESRIKQLTGGDPIAARFMRQDFFTYTPQFKLLIAGNHRPGLRSVNQAIRPRFNLIPFLVTIPEHERDLNFGERLRVEWPGILAWAIEGALQWQQLNLAAPECVRVATAEYLENEDAFTSWLDESCERKPGAWCLTTRLYASWRSWTEKAGEFPGSLEKVPRAAGGRQLLSDPDKSRKRLCWHRLKGGTY